MDRPNILLLLTDQQTLKAMSSAGNPWLSTPHMDRLAREGTQFRASYCASPVCGPSRTSIVTGLMPHRHGMEYHGDPRFDPTLAGMPTFGDLLRQSGYLTAWTGKWHVEEFYPNRPEDLYGFENLPINEESGFELGLNVDGAASDAALAFFQRPHEKPFCLAVSLINPHDICYWIMEIERDQLDPVCDQGELPDLPENFEIPKDEPEFIRQTRLPKDYGREMKWTYQWDEKTWRRYLRAYYRLVETVDVEIGRILEGLDSQGLAENTLVVFTSDHGEGSAAHKLVVKLGVYEEPASVPFLARLPGRIPQGWLAEEEVASGVDLLPTFCDYAGMNPDPRFHGTSLRPVLERKQNAVRGFAVTELVPDKRSPERVARMLRTPDWKYIAFSHGEPSEALYHLRDDPGEMENRSGRPEDQSELIRHRELLRNWLEKTDDPFPCISSTAGAPVSDQ